MSTRPFTPLVVRVSLLALILFALVCLPEAVQAADPTDGRPYIELPFPRDTWYEVTCGYNCYQHRGSMSYSVDFRVPEGDPIVAAAAGEVIAVTWEVGLPANLDLGDALIIYIDHGNNWFTRYVHLQGITVSVGDRVNMGDIIGYSGKTGTQGAHLHFELKHGTSLHSPSVPINELFDGNPPVEERAYLSNNGALPVLAPTAESSAPPLSGEARSVALPTATTEIALGPALPSVSQPLLLSTSTLTQGMPFEVTFTLQNNTASRLHLEMLGIAGRDAGSTSLRSDLLFFDREVILNPGRAYQFSQTVTLNKAGTAELFAFALGDDNEWIPLGGASAPIQISVAPTAQSYQIFLPATLSSRETRAASPSGTNPSGTPGTPLSAPDPSRGR